MYGKIDNLNIELDGNRVVRVEDDALPIVYKGALDFTDDPGNGVEYTYDGEGSLTGDKNRGIAKIDYDAGGYPRRVQYMDGGVTEYVYSAAGAKLRAVHRTAVPAMSVAFGQTHTLTAAETLSADSTDYLGNLVMTGGKPEMYLFDGGYCSFDAAGRAVFHYYDRDHLGNVRAVVGDDGAVEQVMNYYPFGAPYCDETTLNADLQPYKYNGKELETMHGRNAYGYGARFYDPLLPTWDRIDPLCEKYYHVSPYAYCLNNPVNAIDQEGKKVILYATRLPMAHLPLNLEKVVESATHTFLVVQTKSGSQHYYAFGSDRDGLLGAFSGKLSRQRYVQDLNVISDPTNDNLKRMITIAPPQGMSSDEFDQAVINVAESYGNNEQFTYHLNPTTETTGNCNSSTSTVLYKAGLSKEQIKNIGENIPGIKWGWGKTKPWTADEQEKAVQRQKGQEEHLDVLIENLYKGFK